MQHDPPAEVYPGVFIGSLSSIDESHLAAEGIGAIINLSGHYYKSSRATLHIMMSDIPITFNTLESYIKKFTVGATAIKGARSQGVKVLVHCAAGINRSATLIAFYLIEQGHSYDEVLTLLVKANHKRGVELLTNPTFRLLLQSHYEMNKSTTANSEKIQKLN